MFQELCGLLFSVLFDPLRDKDGLFPQEGFEQEKRQLLELKDAEFNDKIVYAHQRCEEILFEGQPAGVNRHGSRAVSYTHLDVYKRQALILKYPQALFKAFTGHELIEVRPAQECKLSGTNAGHRIDIIFTHV